MRRQRRTGLQDDVARGVVDHAVGAAGALQLDGVRERPAPHGVDETRRHHVKMDVDRSHR